MSTNTVETESRSILTSEYMWTQRYALQVNVDFYAYVRIENRRMSIVDVWVECADRATSCVSKS